MNIIKMVNKTIIYYQLKLFKNRYIFYVLEQLKQVFVLIFRKF